MKRLSGDRFVLQTGRSKLESHLRQEVIVRATRPLTHPRTMVTLHTNINFHPKARLYGQIISMRDITEYEDVAYSERTANVSEDMNTDKSSTASSGLTLYYIQYS